MYYMGTYYTTYPVRQYINLVSCYCIPFENFQKLIRMNMPVEENQTVHFTTTLFALIRESLAIKMGPSKMNSHKFLRTLVNYFFFYP